MCSYHENEYSTEPQEETWMNLYLYESHASICEQPLIPVNNIKQSQKLLCSYLQRGREEWEGGGGLGN